VEKEIGELNEIGEPSTEYEWCGNGIRGELNLKKNGAGEKVSTPTTGHWEKVGDGGR